VITSSQAACRVLAERLPAGAPVLVVGGEGLRVAAVEAGLTVVASADDEPAAVVQGYAPDVGWRLFAEATVAINRGAFWLATNLDRTLPSARGPLPGNGSLVAAVRTATGVDPPAAGKPDPAMHRESVLRSGAANPIVVGDRLDTDIEGAARVGCDSLLVLTGVTTAADLLAAPPGQRPSYLAAGLDGLLVPHPAPARDGSDGWACGRWRAGGAGSEGGLTLAGAAGSAGADRADSAAMAGVAAGPAAAAAGSAGVDGSVSADGIDALRALCAAAWAGAAADGGRPAGVRGDGPAATAVLARLGLDRARSAAATPVPTGRQH
jgi:ribonucleotide monophosphatase NagD (HAD superfamily)